MSETEGWQGTLRKVDLGNKSQEEWIQEQLSTTELDPDYNSWQEAYSEESYLRDFEDHYLLTSSGEVYLVEKKKLDPYGFTESTLNSDGSISFTTLFYNGGTYLDEILSECLEKHS